MILCSFVGIVSGCYKSGILMFHPRITAAIKDALTCVTSEPHMPSWLIGMHPIHALLAQKNKWPHFSFPTRRMDTQRLLGADVQSSIDDTVDKLRKETSTLGLQQEEWSPAPSSLLSVCLSVWNDLRAKFSLQVGADSMRLYWLASHYVATKVEPWATHFRKEDGSVEFLRAPITTNQAGCVCTPSPSSCWQC